MVKVSIFFKFLIVLKVEFKYFILLKDNFNVFNLEHIFNDVIVIILLFSAFKTNKLGKDSLKVILLNFQKNNIINF
jgi:hypothetical protein